MYPSQTVAHCEGHLNYGDVCSAIPQSDQLSLLRHAHRRAELIESYPPRSHCHIDATAICSLHKAHTASRVCPSMTLCTNANYICHQLAGRLEVSRVSSTESMIKICISLCRETSSIYLHERSERKSFSDRNQGESSLTKEQHRAHVFNAVTSTAQP